VRLINLYGPTEAAIDVSAFDCPAGQALSAVPIGAPIANIRLYILDAQGRPQPIGVPGELAIAGVGLARGYLGRPGLTAQSFVPNPFRPGERLYRTGDLARWLPDGLIAYLGRRDHQVKLRGFRIELGEVEAALLTHPQVAEAVVLVREVGSGEQMLCGYVVARGPLEAATLRAHLAGVLPAYMVPAHLVLLDRLPLLPNGKVDRKALLRLEITLPSQTPSRAPRSAMERELAAIWQTLLEVDQVSIEDNFFDLGGHSLKATQLLLMVYQVHIRAPHLARTGHAACNGNAAGIRLHPAPGEARAVSTYLGAAPAVHPPPSGRGGDGISRAGGPGVRWATRPCSPGAGAAGPRTAT
jgi:hypothetical protein